MEIPHIETRWDFMQRRDDYSINLYPNPKLISKVRQKQYLVTKGCKKYLLLLKIKKGQAGNGTYRDFPNSALKLQSIRELWDI